MSSSFISNPFYALSEWGKQNEALLSRFIHISFWFVFLLLFFSCLCHLGKKERARGERETAASICIIACLNHLLWQMGMNKLCVVYSSSLSEHNQTNMRIQEEKKLKKNEETTRTRTNWNRLSKWFFMLVGQSKTNNNIHGTITK